MPEGKETEIPEGTQSEFASLFADHLTSLERDEESLRATAANPNIKDESAQRRASLMFSLNLEMGVDIKKLRAGFIFRRLRDLESLEGKSERYQHFIEV